MSKENFIVRETQGIVIIKKDGKTLAKPAKVTASDSQGDANE